MPEEAAGRAVADDGPLDVSTTVGPPPWCHTWETVLTLPSTPDCEISSVPWYDAAWLASAAPSSRRMPMTCWLTVTRLSTVTVAPAARCTAATLLRSAARAVAGATGNGPDSGVPSSAAVATPASAATCSCPTTARMASRPGTVTVATAVISRPWRITESPPPPERARTRPLGLRTGRHRR